MRLTLHNAVALLAAAGPILGSPAGDMSAFLDSIRVNRAALPPSLDGRADSGCLSACDILQTGFPDRIATVAANESTYTQEADAYWSASAWTAPTCIYTPTTLDELKAAILAAQRTQCKFAVRSGGHSPFHGFAGIDEGLLISMAGFKDLEYNKDTQVQRSGMGNRWGDIYKSLIETGRLVVGGRLNEVGLALAGGGGLSHLSSLYGWACQNVISYEVMLANGSHVEASYEKNSDLYYGLRIGNNNFGIVTHLNQQTYPMGKVWGGTVIYSGDKAKAFMAALADFQADGQLDRKAAILPYLALTNDTIFATFAYLDPTVKPNAFDAFFQIPNVTDLTKVHDSFYDLASTGLPFLPRWTYAATSALLDKDTYVGIVDIMSSFNDRMHKIASGTLALMTQPISKNMVLASELRAGGDPLGARKEAQLWMGVTAGWANGDDDAAVFRIVQDCTDAIEAYTKDRGFYDPLIFVNDAFPTQKPLQSFGADSYAKLRAASAKYDPDGVFQKLVPGGFKLI
ncbi:oxidase/Diels-Alderase [Penicillium chermesinum]|uniref:Oxidase/Diels-Alderase n=1 Tax=Penicillium chermesinum TaxID=63820 RepID=A0A9W9TCG6_9EURO|nr:oxidase/Diels-Alderase [Penicillium chermesinum]KAJ5217446.1 oxidase/Diels-Alderase [Penicillium chermesinum]KAJ6170942.1 oxidase/Diels-Alderase [Penicillium chermesinum]